MSGNKNVRIPTCKTSWMGRFGRSERGPAKRSDEETHSGGARVRLRLAKRRAQACRTGPPPKELQAEFSLQSNEVSGFQKGRLEIFQMGSGYEGLYILIYIVDNGAAPITI